MKCFGQDLLKSFEINNAIGIGCLGLRKSIMRAVVNLLMSSQVCNEIVFSFLFFIELIHFPIIIKISIKRRFHHLQREF